MPTNRIDNLSTPDMWLRFLDGAEISATILYPTSALGFGFAKDDKWCADLAVSYNDYVADAYLKVSPRLKAVALLPVQDPVAAARELRRAVHELGFVGGLLPAVGLQFPYGHEIFDPLYREAQELGTLLAVHGAPKQGLGELMDHYPVGDAYAMAIMFQFNSMIHDRVYERFPRLKVAFLEASCGWVPYAIERIDHRSAKLARNLALEQVINHPIYFHASLEDQSVLPFTISVIGDDRLLFASDFPHEGLDAEAVGGDIEHFLARSDLRPESARKIPSDKVKEAYSLA